MAHKHYTVFIFPCKQLAISTAELRMEKVKTRMVIEDLEGVSLAGVYKYMLATLREDVPSYSTVKNWAAEFKHGQDSLQYDWQTCGCDHIGKH